MAASPIRIPEFADPANDGIYTASGRVELSKIADKMRLDATGGPPGGSTPPSGSQSDRRKAIHNEQIKLRATFLNTTTAGFIVAGLITPLTAIGAGTVLPIATPHQALALMAVWLVCSVILHSGGMLTLEATL